MFEGMSIEAGAADPPSREQPHGLSSQQEPSAPPVADANGMFSGLDMAGGEPPPRPGHGSRNNGAALQGQPPATRGGVDMFAGMDTGFQDLNFSAMTMGNHSAQASAASLPSLPPNGSGSPPLSPAASDAAPKLRRQQEGATTARRSELHDVLMTALSQQPSLSRCDADFCASRQVVERGRF